MGIKHRLGQFKNRRGMTLVETVFAMSVLLICALIFAAAFPISTQSRTKTDQRSQAISLAARQLEAARDAGYQSLTTHAGLFSRGVVDEYPATSPYSISDVTLGSNQSIANTLPQGVGTMTVETWINQPMRVTVTITWVEQGQERSITIGTLISDI